MSGQFSDLIRQIGGGETEFPNLLRSYETSQTAVSNARKFLSDADLDTSLDVIGLGSMGRFEMSGESDLDYLIVCHGGDASAHAEAKSVVDELRKVVVPGRELRPPGPTGLFGKVIGDGELYEVIGMEADTNKTHSRRSLVLEESVSLRSPTLHKQLLRKMANRYIEAIPLGRSKVPRFLVNDLARYWRQLTVDYQAKSESGLPSSLRRLKLIGPRKFTYASSVLPLLMLELRDLTDKEEVIDRLVEVFQLPPTLRFLSEIEYLSATGASSSVADHALEAMKAVDVFNGLLANASWRQMIEGVTSRGEAEAIDEFSRARGLARTLQMALDEVFFSSELQQLTRKYLVF